MKNLVLIMMSFMVLLAQGNEEKNDKDAALSVMEVENEDDNDATVSIQYDDNDGDFDPDVESFQPTSNWQTIKPGQRIPKGLHVRMNLQTGLKEAKLLDPNEPDGDTTNDGSADPILRSDPGRLQRMKEAIEQAINEIDTEKKQGSSEDDLRYWKEGEKEGIVNKNKDYFTRDELKEALKKFKTAKEDASSAEEIRAKYRPMEELKKDFEALNIGVKTDLEILSELVEKYKSSDLNVETHVNLLTDVEYYVHQIDNAINFMDMGGLELLTRDLNHTEERIRQEAVFVFGSASQNNPKVQVKVLEAGVMQQLIRQLSTEASSQSRSRVLYALSCLVRHFPYAQQRFLELGGLHTLATVFSQPTYSKLQLKIITLVNDLLMERKLTAEHGNKDDAITQEKLKQYERIPLPQAIQEQGWCDQVASLLRSDDHDTREKVLLAMDTFMDLCKAEFTEKLPVLLNFKTEYMEYSREETHGTGDTYFTDMLKTVNGLISRLQQKDEL